MDTSREYINMCALAQDIQKSSLALNNGDYYERKNEYDKGVRIYSNGIGEAPHVEIVWLPRQDQLQEMLMDDFLGFENYNEHDIKHGLNWNQRCKIDNMFNTFRNWYFPVNHLGYIDDDGIEEGLFNSFEQLWLGFVMKDKHDKEWVKDKKEWILLK